MHPYRLRICSQRARRCGQTKPLAGARVAVGDRLLTRQAEALGTPAVYGILAAELSRRCARTDTRIFADRVDPRDHGVARLDRAHSFRRPGIEHVAGIEGVEGRAPFDRAFCSRRSAAWYCSASVRR